ncbi:MAG: hypothetical protein WA053_02215, partial [Minisyncoccia bacterium]
MKNYILGVFLALGFLVSPVFVHQAEAAALSAGQISAIIGLLQAFGADQSVIANVQAALGGGTESSQGGPLAPTASIMVNGAHAVTVPYGDTIATTWSSTGGTTWSSTMAWSPSSSCTTQDSRAYVANSANGSSSGMGLSSDFIGCTIAITYTVTNAAGSASDTANITVAPATVVTNYTKTDYNIGMGYNLSPWVIGYLGNHIWVASGNSLIKVDASTGVVAARYPGFNVHSMAVDPSTSSLWVGDLSANTVTKVDGQTGAKGVSYT